MYRFCLAALLLFMVCCTDKPSRTSDRNAFYYWLTDVSRFPWSDSTYKALNVSKLYLRFFDVDWSEQSKIPMPVSPINFYYAYNSFDTAVEIVPVVFITNETFSHLNDEQSRALAHNVHKKVMNKLNGLFEHRARYDYTWWQQNPYNVKSKNFDEQTKRDSTYAANLQRIHEVQFDCDWTKTTKTQYFAFLDEAKKLFPAKLISSTIRLYQYKYPAEAGIPPVKRGMLMCYNAGDIRSSKTTNSIFDKAEIMSYLEAKQYPIPLDYALPVFNWALLYQEGQLKRILSTATLYEEYQRYLGPTDPGNHRAVVQEDFVYGDTDNGIYIRTGDEIRFEQPDLEDVQEVAAWLSKQKNNEEAIVSLYHLNEHDLQKHSEAIQAIFDIF
jgi:hypothetical protein